MVGPLFVCTQTAVMLLSGYYIFFLLMPRRVWFGLLGALLLLAETAAYTLTALLNPGMPSRDLSKYKQDYIDKLIAEKSFAYCRKCKVVRDLNKTTQHCTDCDICVEGFDHHCPWTGKCIGSGNTVCFHLFLFGFLVLVLFIMFSSILAFYPRVHRFWVWIVFGVLGFWGFGVL
ncbi:MAG: hypothetical protein P4M11_15735, partial [Candidatus Pacebacteria bacterium]|nr:hypothetical protein [Candidatus Paceibacterota bacterium]